MRILAQLGFDFGDANVESPKSSLSQTGVPSAPAQPLRGPSVQPVPAPRTLAPPRGRAARRAQTAVLLSRLTDLGLRGVDELVLMRTRSVMVSRVGGTLRVHEGYVDAPEPVLRAVVTFAMTRTRAGRAAARDVILAHDVERGPPTRRIEASRPGDLAIIAQLSTAHREFNDRCFHGALTALTIRLSGRMASRLGHFDPGTRFSPSEIVLSRKHVVRHGWREAMHTLLHEMVHQWQHETGQAVDHGAGFRRKCREVGIAPSAKRNVTPLARLKRA